MGTPSMKTFKTNMNGVERTDRFYTSSRFTSKTQEEMSTTRSEWSRSIREPVSIGKVLLQVVAARLSLFGSGAP